ncbi:RNA polymerase sigma factor [candidate division KSB1 bacterium]|nr:RNA polymerase sigma factor [candidate division KSB1 bacterium]
MLATTEKKQSLEQEREWIQAAQNRAEDFEPLFNRYHDMIFHYCLRRTWNEQLARDLTANTFLKALENIKRYYWQGTAFSSWLYRIAINEINQNYRKIKRMVPLSLQKKMDLPDEKQPDSDLLAEEEMKKQRDQIQRVHAVLLRLNSKYQAVLSLRYFENKSMKEISEILNIPENTVKTRIRRGLITLKKRL